MSNWIAKLKHLFIGEKEVDMPIQTESKQETVSFSIREIESRVQHIYPQAKESPIPLSVPNKQRKVSTNTKRKKVAKTTTSYFQGSLTHSSDTPSPIFGFRKTENELDLNEKARVEHDKQNDEQLRKMLEIDPAIAKLKSNEMDEVKPIRTIEISMANTVDVEPIPTTKAIDKEEQVFIAPEIAATIPSYSYQAPSLSSLQAANHSDDDEEEEWTNQQADLLMETFRSFNLQAELIGITKGPTVTRFEIQPAPGVKINKFTNLQDDLKLNLAVKEIRIEAPIPGKQAIGIEVPNLKPKPVLLGDILLSKEFQESESPLTICLGTDLSGQPVITDIKKMPHGLIAGSTGSGKSVCINSILVSLLYKSNPNQLRLLLIDPKVVELSPYQHIPHLVTPVVTDPKKANAALKWAVSEMERRYQLFAEAGVRDLDRFNRALATQTGEEYTLPYIVIIIDELADLMMVSPQDVEDSICRLTQKARACGIHLIVATQRPSVDVITGLIKANIPTRLAFFVSSQVDSRTILDMAGAERLLGKGDMLFLPNGAGKSFRVQGSYVSDDEIEEVVKQVAIADTQHFLFSADDLTTANQDFDVDDELLSEAVLHIFEQGVASASSLQRKFRIGYNRAARMIEWMEEQGVISESLGSKPRNVLWSEDEILQWLDSQHGNG